jgi:hypothetical protein
MAMLMGGPSAAPRRWRRIFAGCAGSRPDQNGVGRCTGLAIGDDDTLPVSREVRVAPVQQRDKNRKEIAATGGRHIFVPRRMLAVAAAFEQSGLDQ